MDLYLVTAQEKEYDAGFSEVMTEDALNQFLDGVELAIKEGRYESDYDAIDPEFVKREDGEMSLGNNNLHIRWSKIEPITSYPKIETILAGDGGYESTWFQVM